MRKVGPGERAGQPAPTAAAAPHTPLPLWTDPPTHTAQASLQQASQQGRGPASIIIVQPTVVLAGPGVSSNGSSGGGSSSWGSSGSPDWYRAALQNAAAVQQHNWQPATNAARDKAWAELEEWCRARLGRPAQACSPADLLVYQASNWLGAHGRQVLANGARVPAPSTLQTTLAHLSTRFAELGRRGQWDPATGSGNPCLSMELRTFKGGFSNLMQEAGFRPKAAPPLAEAKLQQLVSALVQEADAVGAAGRAPWHVEALLRRDAAMAALLWESYRRPAEVGSLSSSAVSTTGGSVVAQASSSKMCHASQGGRLPRPIEVHGPGGEQLCQLLGSYQSCLERHGQQLGQFLFSPLRRDGSALEGSKGLSAAALTQRLVGHLQRRGMYEGESAYSLKRGGMQHAFYVGGQTLAAVGEAADIDTPAVVQLYLDPKRHL